MRSGRGELIVVYGRRRVGKTSLVRVFTDIYDVSNRVYIVINYEDPSLALRDISRQVSRQVKLAVNFADFDSLFEFIHSLCSKGRLLVIIDEFQRLAGSGFLTKLQQWWDTVLSRDNVVIVLVGSAVRVVEKVGLSADSPIFGRVTKVIKVGPLSYCAARALLSAWSEEDKIRAYAVFGGVPAYLVLIDCSKSLIENIRRLVFDVGAPLREEVLFLLSSETRSPDRYLAILEAVAAGHTRLSEIAGYLGIEASRLSKYLSVLCRDLGLVREVYPLLAEGKRRFGRYEIADEFVRFWMLYVWRNSSLLEHGLVDTVVEQVKNELDDYTSKTFEKVCLEHFTLLAKEGKVSFTRIGKWWYRGTEIDIVAIDEKTNTAYFIECRWTSTKVSRTELNKLIAKASEFPWRRNQRREIYILYSKSGFTFEEDTDTILITLEDMRKTFERHRPKTYNV